VPPFRRPRQLEHAAFLHSEHLADRCEQGNDLQNTIERHSNRIMIICCTSIECGCAGLQPHVRLGAVWANLIGSNRHEKRLKGERSPERNHQRLVHPFRHDDLLRGALLLEPRTYPTRLQPINLCQIAATGLVRRALQPSGAHCMRQMTPFMSEPPS
jgi:hypothetical protein